MVLAAGLDGRLAPFIAGYVLVLALFGPLIASRSESITRLITGWREKKEKKAMEHSRLQR
jgi:monovalent cation:H+ antiporter-2, CPA2 family